MFHRVHAPQPARLTLFKLDSWPMTDLILTSARQFYAYGLDNHFYDCYDRLKLHGVFNLPLIGRFAN